MALAKPAEGLQAMQEQNIHVDGLLTVRNVVASVHSYFYPARRRRDSACPSLRGQEHRDRLD